jgi:hypothetical protein
VERRQALPYGTNRYMEQWIQSPISVMKSGPRVLPDSSTGMSSPCKPKNRQKHDGWYVPTSTKSIRAVNPVSFAFERLTNKVKLGSQRKDGKDPISLAVSSHARVFLSIKVQT